MHSKFSKKRSPFFVFFVYCGGLDVFIFIPIKQTAMNKESYLTLLEGLRKTHKVLQEEIAFLLKEWSFTADQTTKFGLKKQIQNAIDDLQEIDQQIEHFAQKQVPEPSEAETIQNQFDSLRQNLESIAQKLQVSIKIDKRVDNSVVDNSTHKHIDERITASDKAVVVRGDHNTTYITHIEKIENQNIHLKP